ncbi:MAG: alkaline phosphatase D family protein [Chitinophagales bacterium]
MKIRLYFDLSCRELKKFKKASIILQTVHLCFGTWALLKLLFTRNLNYGMALVLVLFCVSNFSCQQQQESLDKVNSYKQNAADSDEAANDAIPTQSKLIAALANDTIQRIAFGSCNKQSAPQPLWQEILAHRPDVWLWTGDNIYGDTEDMNVLRKKYAQQKENGNYQALLRSTPIFGIWDDHDYGKNDGNKLYPKRKESRDLMLDFLDVPKDNPVWQREGAYQSYELGQKGKRIKVILLDTRYFQDQLQRNPNRKAHNNYLLDTTGTILGEAQWAWLTNELSKSTAQIHLIISSIQVLANDHGYEKWGNFPKERQRLLDLLAQNQVSHPILISGDRHIGEISKMPLQGANGEIFHLYDITSSGLTHSYRKAKEENQLRVSPLVVNKNYGLLKIDWTQEQPSITVNLSGLEGTVFYEETLEF